MDLDQLIRDADPAHELRIDPPDPSQIRNRATGGRRGPPRWTPTRWPARLTGRVALAGAVLVVVVVVGVVVAFSGRNSNPPRVSYPTVDSQPTHSIALGILQRPQTSRDRTLPGVILRAGRLGGFPKQAAQDLKGVIPSTMRYAQTLPDGQEVFLAQTRAPHGRQAVLEFFVVTPDGSSRYGQPVDTASDGVPKRIPRDQGPVAAGCTANLGSGGSIRGITEFAVVSNAVARVSWHFSAKDTGGAPRTVSVPVRGNTAVATVSGIASCNGPSWTTTYDKNGNEITRALGNELPHRIGTPPPVRYPRNQHGQTYGSAAGAATPSQEPQLIAASGKTASGEIVSGYVRRWQLNEGSCSNVKTPAAAVKCTKTRNHSRTIPLLARNGTTVIGHFTQPGS